MSRKREMKTISNYLTPPFAYPQSNGFSSKHFPDKEKLIVTVSTSTLELLHKLAASLSFSTVERGGLSPYTGIASVDISLQL